MKDKADLVRGWVRKADSDLLALEASLTVGALDAACFHAQQAAEKYLKAYLVAKGIEFPLTHNLSKLLELCATVDPSFRSMESIAEPLTPYAVEMRYDSDFWPDVGVAEEAKAAAVTVKQFVLARISD
ncbi:MAG TPA: HEPN domain-containing protein [Armatimonadota bacterium]|nr:HEPN domain-containing protein [Armatimonadota bacterium]